VRSIRVSVEQENTQRRGPRNPMLFWQHRGDSITRNNSSKDCEIFFDDNPESFMSRTLDSSKVKDSKGLKKNAVMRGEVGSRRELTNKGHGNPFVSELTVSQLYALWSPGLGAKDRQIIQELCDRIEGVLDAELSARQKADQRHSLLALLTVLISRCDEMTSKRQAKQRKICEILLRRLIQITVG
jgi:hypothetical protein